MEEASPGKKPKFAPLPEAKYVPSRVALEQKLTPTSEQKELPKAFGATKETQVTVVKHLGRVRVPKQAVSEVSSAEDVELKKAPTRYGRWHSFYCLVFQIEGSCYNSLNQALFSTFWG